MKTWTMPRVEIEAFCANEYCATCDIISPIVPDRTYYYWDAPGGTANFYDGPQSGENIWIYEGHYTIQHRPNPAGWYRDVTLYRGTSQNSVNLPSGGSYTDTNDFTKVDGTYDLFFDKTSYRVYIYKHESAPGGVTPSPDKTFS